MMTHFKCCVYSALSLFDYIVRWPSHGFTDVFLFLVGTIKCLLTLFPRHAGMLELSVENLHGSNRDSDGFAVFLNHDLSMLRLIEAFAESAPQLVLMLTIILHRNQFDPVTGTEKLQSGLTRRKPLMPSYIFTSRSGSCGI